MRWKDQGVCEKHTYQVQARTLTFLLHEGRVLLLRGAHTKRLWPGRLNGVGGHVRAGEDVASSACREVTEETGLRVFDLVLRAIVHLSGRPDDPTGVMLFVFVGQAPQSAVTPGVEGQLEWHPVDRLPWDQMVDDLPSLLPRILDSSAADGVVYSLCGTDDGGVLPQSFPRR